MIYLDHHAATPLSAAARDALSAVLSLQANPSSAHGPGRAVRAHIESARRAVAAGIGASPADIVLTSGGTEACNLALASARGPVAISALEHPAVTRAAERITRATGSTLIHLDALDPLGALDRALALPDLLVAVQWVNHETGAILPIERIAERCRAKGARLFVDATQALGKLPIDVDALPIDLLALSSAKVGGPLGAGALYLRRGIDLDPLLVGSADERGRRAGSPGLLPMVGFAAALGELPSRLSSQSSIAVRRDALEAALLARGAVANFVGPRVATVTSVSLKTWRGPMLVAALDLEGLAVSSGAACSSGLGEPSPILLALHPRETWRASSGLRLSLGPETTDHDITEAISILDRVLARSTS